MTEELRLYTWTLYQLSPIQQGIQAAHATVELAMKCYREQGVLRQGTNWNLYHEWATNWKTMVCLNGGDLNELRETYEFFCHPDRTVPWAAFHEDESLGGCMTSIAAIIPARIFNTVAEIRKARSAYGVASDLTFTPFEWALIDKLVATGLAR